MNSAIADIYPLAPLQQGMLFHSLLAPQSGAYVVQVSFAVEGAFSPSAFEQAWQQAIDRHTILRTAFVWENLEKPLQVVGRYAKLPVVRLDWQQVTNQNEKLQDLLQAQRHEGFILTQAPLMCLTLIQTGCDRWHFIWCYHHLLLDGWSVPLLLQEVLADYQILTHSGSLNVRSTPRPYRDYIAWLQQQDTRAAEQFWRQALSGFYAPTPLICPAPVLSSSPSPYSEQQLQLSPQLTALIQTFAQQQQITLNTLIQAAYALLLSRYSDESDVVFGVTSSGRPPELSDSSQMIGLFINTLPLRAEISPQQRLFHWLQDIQENQVNLRQYEFTSLIDIHRWSEVSQSTPLFETMLIFENYPISPQMKQSLHQIHLKDVQTTEQTNYPLALYVVAEESITLRFAYDRDRFSPSVVIQMLEHLQVVISSMVENPNQLVSEISLITSTEQDCFTLWNDTATDLDFHCFPQRFAQQVEKTPDAIAAVFETQHLTYAALNDRATALAHAILAHNPTAPIAIYLPRSLDLLIALIAVQKSGCSYLPLDPALPFDRLRFMITDAQAGLLITSEELPPIPATLATTVKPIDLPTLAVDVLPSAVSLPQVFPHQSAYLLYTSGSTGTPKAVQILHRSLANFLASMQQQLSVSATDTLLAITPLSFDIAALELYLPLTVGATVVIAPREVARDGCRLADTIERHPITFMQATPATWRMLLSCGWNGKLDLTLLCGGEALDRPLAHQLLSHGRALWNLYGPTETTIWSTLHQVTGSEDRSLIPIGRPIANTECYVVDRHLQPVPIGVAGELCIGGMGLAQGYLGRPELTAERFIPNPFSASTRLYRTGDRVRYLPDGTLEYLERLDYQVKLRGYRIELGEIEAALLSHPQVTAAIAVVRQSSSNNSPDHAQLVAYIIPHEVAPPVPELRAYLQAQLPAYMIPSFFVPLKQFPLTPNGKIDRNALPPPEAPVPTAPMLPKTGVEQAIAAVWQQVLNVEKVGIHDNFFDLGGNSLLLVKAHTQLRAQFPAEQSAIELSLLDLFRYPTVGSLAAHLSRASPTLAAEPPPDSRQTQLTAGKARLQQRREARTQPQNS
jgi:surfactin family lipopeptide synthetase C